MQVTHSHNNFTWRTSIYNKWLLIKISSVKCTFIKVNVYRFYQVHECNENRGDMSITTIHNIIHTPQNTAPII